MGASAVGFSELLYENMFQERDLKFTLQDPDQQFYYLKLGLDVSTEGFRCVVGAL